MKTLEQYYRLLVLIANQVDSLSEEPKGEEMDEKRWKKGKRDRA